MSRLQSPRFLLGLIALLTAIAVQPGDLGSIDTVRRLQVTHWMWTSAPQVAPGDFPGFGVPGRNGKIYAWYGIGQSLLMLPGDMAATALTHAVPALRGKYDLRGLLLTYSLSPLICTLAVLAAFRFLQQLGFSIRQSVAGALGLLFATTFLHYTQNMMENNLLLLLFLTGFGLQYKWLQTGSNRALAAGSIVLGSAMLVRLTTALDIVTVAVFMALAIWRSESNSTRIIQRMFHYAKMCAPSYILFFLIDRGYHYYRFGQCCTNYIQLYGQQQRIMDPTLPASFPYTMPFWQGFWGPLITPEKSIFLFDPLLIIVAALAILSWKRLAPHLKMYLGCMSILLVTYIAFHARLWFWAGDVAWGDRYVTTPVQMLALLAIPLLLRHGPELGKAFRSVALTLVCISVLVQTESIMLPAWVEFRQMRTLGHPTLVIGLRLLNIVGLASAEFSEKNLAKNDASVAGGTSSIYLYPFQVVAEARHVPRWASLGFLGAWMLLVASVGVMLRRLNVVLSTVPTRTETWDSSMRLVQTQPAAIVPEPFH